MEIEKTSYKNMLQNFIKNRLYIYLIIFIEFYQIWFNSINFFLLIFEKSKPNNFEDDMGYINYYLKYISLNYHLKVAFSIDNYSNSTNSESRDNNDSITSLQASSEENAIIEYNYIKHEYDIYFLLCIFLFIYLNILIFLFFINCERHNLNVINNFSKKNLNGNIYNSNSNEYIPKITQYKYLYFVNFCEMIFHVFGEFILIVVFNSFICSFQESFLLEAIDSIYHPVQMLISIITLIMYLFIYITYIKKIRIIFNFSKLTSCHYDNIFSYKYDYLNLISKILASLINTLCEYPKRNELTIKILAFFFLLNYIVFFFHQNYYCLIKQGFLYIINENYNFLRLFFINLFVMIILSRIIIDHKFKIDADCILSIIAFTSFALILTFHIKKENKSNFLNDENSILNQMIFIINSIFTEKEKKILDNVSKIILYHKIKYRYKACFINFIYKFKISSFLNASLKKLDRGKIHFITKENQHLLYICKIFMLNYGITDEEEEKKLKKNVYREITESDESLKGFLKKIKKNFSKNKSSIHSDKLNHKKAFDPNKQKKNNLERQANLGELNMKESNRYSEL